MNPLMFKFMVFFLTIIAILLVLFVATVLTSPQARADTEVGVILKSHHFSGENHNEVNPGIFIIHNNFVIGGFKNSHSNTSVLLGMKSDFYKAGPIQLSLLCGIIYGYGWNNGYADADVYGKRLLPYMLPTLSIKISDTKINTHYMGAGFAWSISKEF